MPALLRCPPSFFAAPSNFLHTSVSEQNTTWSLARIPVYRLSAEGQDSDSESVTHWPSLVSMATDLREAARSHAWEEAGECGATYCPDA